MKAPTPATWAQAIREDMSSRDIIALFDHGRYTKIVRVTPGRERDLTRPMACAFLLPLDSGPAIPPAIQWRDRVIWSLTPGEWLYDLDVWAWLNALVAARVPFYYKVERYVRRKDGFFHLLIP